MVKRPQDPCQSETSVLSYMGFSVGATHNMAACFFKSNGSKKKPVFMWPTFFIGFHHFFCVLFLRRESQAQPLSKGRGLHKITNTSSRDPWWHLTGCLATWETRKGLEEPDGEHSAKPRKALCTKNRKIRGQTQELGLGKSPVVRAHKPRGMPEHLKLRRSYFPFSGLLHCN